MFSLAIAASYFSYQKGYVAGNTSGVTEGMRIEKTYYNENEDKLKSCLDEAELKFNNIRDINSKKDPTPEHPNAMKWNSTEIKLQTEDQYNKDKEFCLKLNK